MAIPRMTALTLGVQDLARATAFYTQVFGTRPSGDYEGVAFFTLPGVWLMLYPREKLAADIQPGMASAPGGFSGVTLGYNARSEDEVRAVFAQVAAAGATIVKPPHATFWGGYSGYFADLDGYYWEVAWGPMFTFAADGELQFKR